MQINSVNSPTFGCGGCTAAYKKAEHLATIRGTEEFRVGAWTARNLVKKSIHETKVENPDLTHGQIASAANKAMGDKIIKKLRIKV